MTMSVVRRLSSLEVDSDRGETVICHVWVLSGSRTGACAVPLTLEPTAKYNAKPVTSSSHHLPKLQLQYSQKLATGSYLEPLGMNQRFRPSPLWNILWDTVLYVYSGGVRSFETWSWGDYLFSSFCDCLMYLQLLPCLKPHSSIRNLRTLRAVFESDIKKPAIKVKLVNSSALVKFILVWEFWSQPFLRTTWTPSFSDCRHVVCTKSCW